MKNRRRQGATLGLVAVCVLVIIVVGIGCFFLAKIFGGGREVANATDAGALNIAKSTMKRNGDPMVSVDASAYPNFVDCSDPPNTQITLLTYNRCVAQALLVAMNAQAETAMGATAANGAANTVLLQLNNLGTVLASKLEDKTTMISYFNNVKNDTRMWGSNDLKAVQQTYLWAFMKPKESTNVYFTNTELAGLTLPNNWKSIGTDRVPLAAGAFGGAYLRGYENLAIAGVGNIIGVPVFPQQNPHLVALADFQKGNNPPGPSVPPNSFSVASNATESKSGNFGGAVAAAIVGAVKQVGGAGGKYDWAAAIPGGYIELANLPGSTLPAGYKGFDNSDNIFNNELWLGPGIDIGATSNGAAFDVGNTPSAVNAWADFNNSSATDASGDGKNSGTFVDDGTGHNKNLYPPSIGFPLSNMRVVNSGTGTGTAPSSDVDLRTITKHGVNCLDQLNANGLTGLCDNAKNGGFLEALENTYHPGPSGNSAADPAQIYSGVDLVKGEVIQAFQSGNRDIQINAPGNVTGLGVYPNQNGPNPTPFYTAPIQRTGTIMQLLDQVTTGPNQDKDANGNDLQPPGCTKAAILAQMTQRCYEIKPDAAPGDISALWNQQLPMGDILYIYLPGGDPTQKLTISPTPPSTRKAGPCDNGTGTCPDGVVAQGSTLNCGDTYSLVNAGGMQLVDVEKTSIPADANLHDKMYRNVSGNITGSDHAKWTLSTGLDNLVGKMEFSNSTAGGEHFSRPN